MPDTWVNAMVLGSREVSNNYWNKIDGQVQYFAVFHRALMSSEMWSLSTMSGAVCDQQVPGVSTSEQGLLVNCCFSRCNKAACVTLMN